MGIEQLSEKEQDLLILIMVKEVIAYATENHKTFEETKLDSIDFVNCTFENISITMKGKAYICADTFKESGKAFYEKSKPVIKQITSTALQVMVEQVVVSGMKAVGFSV